MPVPGVDPINKEGRPFEFPCCNVAKLILCYCQLGPIYSLLFNIGRGGSINVWHARARRARLYIGNPVDRAMKCVYIVRERSKPPYKYVYEHCYKIGMSDHWATRDKYYRSHGYDILWWMPVSHPRILEGAMKSILCNLSCSEQNTEVFCFPQGHKALSRLIRKTWKELQTFVKVEYGSQLCRADDDTTLMIERYVHENKRRYKWLHMSRIHQKMVRRVKKRL